MIKPGSIVLQKNTLINKINYKDNKTNRLSVVLFEFKKDNKDYICSCPITNRKQISKNVPKNLLFIPYEILNDNKLCCIKLDSVFFYPKNEISDTGLNLKEQTVLKIYNSLLDLDINDFALNLEQCKTLKDNIEIIKTKLNKEGKNLNKRK